MSDETKFGAIAFVLLGVVFCWPVEKLASIVLIVMLLVGISLLAIKR